MIRLKPILFVTALFACVCVFSGPLSGAEPEKTPYTPEKIEKPESPEETGSPDAKIPEITVTAEKRQQTLSDLVFSTAVFTGEDIREMGADDMEDVARHSPGLFFAEQAPGQAQFNIRGVGSASFAESALSVFVDGILIPGLTSGSFYDVERIEILRGPQGTLYGINSQAGVINIVTNAPSFKQEGEGGTTIKYGNYNHLSSGLVFSGPLSKKVAFRQALNYTMSDGYFTNTALDRDDVENIDDFLSISKLTYRQDKTASLSAVFFSRVADNGYDSWQTLAQIEDDPYETTSDSGGFATVDVYGLAVKYEKKFEAFEMAATTVYSSSSTAVKDDISFTSVPGFPINSILVDKTFYTASQEVKFNSKKRKDSRLEWVAGAFYQSRTEAGETYRDLTMDIGFGPVDIAQIPSSTTETRSAALYGQATWKATDNLELTAGLRLDSTEREFDWSMVTAITGLGASENTTVVEWDDFQILPRAAVAYKVAPWGKTFLALSRGYKVGGFNGTAETEAEASVPYDSEFFWHYELGIKGDVAKKRHTYSCSVFYIDFRDQQVASFDNAALHFKNAGESYSRGVQLELASRISKAWRLDLAATATEAEFEEYVDSSGNDFEGNRFPCTPKNHWKIGVTHKRPGGMFAAAEVVGVGDYRLDDYNEIHQNAYQLVNLKLGYKTERWSVSAWGRNLLSEEYLVRGFGPTTVGGLPLEIGRLGAPLTFGFDLHAEF